MSLNRITGLLNQSCSVSTVGAVDKFGKHTYAAAATYACRFQRTTRVIATKQNEVEPIDGIVFLDSDAVVAIDDKLTFNSIDYRVMRIEPMIDGRGNTRHYELLVQKWNT